MLSDLKHLLTFHPLALLSLLLRLLSSHSMSGLQECFLHTSTILLSLCFTLGKEGHKVKAGEWNVSFVCVMFLSMKFSLKIYLLQKQRYSFKNYFSTIVSII